MIKKINHVAIALPDLAAGQKFWAESLGLSLERVSVVPDEGVTVAFLSVGDAEIELLHPLDGEGGVAKFLQKRGAGIHHICFEVEDIEQMLAELKSAGIPLINETPRLNPDGKQYAFLHPKGTGGILIELYQTSPIV